MQSKSKSSWMSTRPYMTWPFFSPLTNFLLTCASLTLFYSHWISCCSQNMLVMLPPDDLCTSCASNWDIIILVVLRCKYFGCKRVCYNSHTKFLLILNSPGQMLCRTRLKFYKMRIVNNNIMNKNQACQNNMVKWSSYNSIT